ncbi:hypothetical protein SV7mr_07450 [Stieleria bergensis]|uniref:GEVED domain-containing protein n=1 Tax=Stieleria bergensis TaxID=2528025 RepID=A0A517SQ54_9BACT|nr:hypothetical protein SV7mr_07450 [Planctomycetes bacterium SV_7m_r]
MTFRNSSQSDMPNDRQPSMKRSTSRLGDSKRRRSQRADRKRHAEKRRSLLESLENRQLLAGPELIGIQPNEGGLLFGGESLDFSPKELVFRFDDSTNLDPTTLDGIRITRAGEDGVFEAASATSDLGSNGLSLFEFRSQQSGSLGNGVTINVLTNPSASSRTPVITVADRAITVTLSTSPFATTQAGDLVAAFNSDLDSSALAQVIQVSGSSAQPLGGGNINGSTLELRGANSAQAVTDLGSNGAVRVRLVSQLPGADGRGVKIEVGSQNFGGPANPVVVVTDKTIRMQLNSYQFAPSTAQDFINAINSNPQASELVVASVQQGDASIAVGGNSTSYSPLELSGVSDVFVEPGWVGLGDSPREVVFRFAEPLPDDLYQVDVIGSGPAALRAVDGERFNDGEDLTRIFDINLGPRVVAVVPEPVRRENDGTLSAETGIIEVHFNDDDLNQTQAEDPSFYSLIFTQDTVDNKDDIVVPLTPGSVSYNNVTNIARLNYGNPLSRLPVPGSPGEVLSGSVRLRIGSSDSLPSGPQTVTLPVGSSFAPDGAGDSFNTAFDLNSQWTLGTGTTQSAILNSEIRNETPYDLRLPGPDVPGTREIRAEDPSRIDRPVPLDYVRNAPDSVDGISVIEYDFVSSWLGDDPNRSGITNDTSYFNIISEQQQERAREALTLFSQYLGVNFVEVKDRDPVDIGGFSIAVGDLYGGDPLATSANGGTAVVTADRDADGIDDIVVMDFQDFDESIDDSFGGEFFRGAMFGIGQLLGYGYADDLPQPTTQSTGFVFQPGTNNEPAFPSHADIINGQYLYRPDSTDIDMYRFELSEPGSIAIEATAERLAAASLLDTHLRLYKQESNGEFVEVAQNDDYFSNDSLIRLDSLSAGVYMIGVSASGNDAYEPAIADTGFGGLSEGDYQLRVDFTPSASSMMFDTTGVALDGDGDGRPGGTFNYWINTADISETLYIDKGEFALHQPTGSISHSQSDLNFIDAFRTRTIGYANNPYSEIDHALNDARRIMELRSEAMSGSLLELNALRSSSNPADVQRGNTLMTYLRELNITVRVVGNGGLDGLVQTPEDNFSYQIGFQNNGLPMVDGTDLELPADVQMIVDTGAILKFANSRIGVGSTAPTIDLSGSNLQILGTPSIVLANGLPARDTTNSLIPGSVYLTSYFDSTVGTGNQPQFLPSPAAGDWGGLDFRGDLDAADELRRNHEENGVFLNHVQFANIQYGGGRVSIGGREVVVSPIDMAETRVTVVNSTLRNSADAAIAATPNTFRETRFTAATYQADSPFTPDYTRVGPEIHGNEITDNSINGLFIRLTTRSGEDLETITTATRFDDTDITHVLAENLIIEGTPGGPVIQSGAPASVLVRLFAEPINGAVPAGQYEYRITNVDSLGLESAISDPTVRVTTTSTGGIRLRSLPTPAPGSDVAARNLYRATVDPSTGLPGPYELVSVLNATNTSFLDQVEQGGALLTEATSPLRSRLDGSLVIDPSTVLKIDSARIEARFGANFVAEGTPGNPVIITSLNDIRYGNGGTFETNSGGDSTSINPGDWGGLFIGHAGSASIDNAVIAGGGGTTRIEGGFASFNAIEVHQGDLRLTNSRVEFNADGRGSLNETRAGRSDNAPGAVFIRAATPILVNNDFIDNDAAAISIDINSLNAAEVQDNGRSTGAVNRFDVVANNGPLVEDNSLTRNEINGMLIRGGELVTEGVWDDVDIVHVVTDTIEIPNRFVFGGLRLLSDARGSLVVKLRTEDGQETTDPAAIIVGGSLLTAENEFVDIADRIGGALQLIGHPDFPVVMTALSDDFAGAGFTIDGFAAVDTDNDGIISGVDSGSDASGGDAGTSTPLLPVGPEINNGNLIDNDVDPTIPGSFSAEIGDGNLTDFTLTSDITIEDVLGQVQVINDPIFAYDTYVIESGTATSLSASTITQGASLIGDDLVESRGELTLASGQVIQWVATSRFEDGIPTLLSTVEFSSTTAMPELQIVSYLDEDVSTTNDFLYTVGTPGQADFRLYTVDSVNRVGFSHGGFYIDDGTNQQNAVYNGWAADIYDDLETQIQAGTQTFSIGGDIDLTDLPAAIDPILGDVFGPADVTTAHSWTIAANSTTATVTSFLELLAEDAATIDSPDRSDVAAGLWDGVTIREGAYDRNVASAAESEPVRTTVFDTNAIPSQSQFLGELAPDEQSGDENRRLGFIVDGAITTGDDLDVYSFIAESNTEVWLDIDRTSRFLDTVIELVDINGEVLASSNDSLAGEDDQATGFFVSSRLDQDAVQPLTVAEDRMATLRINLDGAVDDASFGEIALQYGDISSAVATIPVADFSADPVLALETAINETFGDLVGQVTVNVQPREAGEDYVLQVVYDEDFYIAQDVPTLSLSMASVFPQVQPATMVQEVHASVLQDTYSINEKDAGMRLRLPGEIGTRNLYHVRVRSSNTRDADDYDTLINGDLRGGLTRGRYQMQIRLRETDEVAGTQIKLADIRYATNGLQIIGQPFHSPLTGDEAETTAPNDSIFDAQRVGNFGASDDATAEAGPLSSDKLSKSIAGEISSQTDVDWYSFDIQYKDLTRDQTTVPLATIIDLDYASNFARTDMAFYVFDSSGRLIYSATDSNIANDLPATPSSNSADDLSRGGAGVEDPFLGSVELGEGTYYLAIANETQVPVAMDQFFNINSNTPLLRAAPLDAVSNIVDDTFDLFGTDSFVPYSMDDVLLYVNTPTGLFLVNPFTGDNYGFVGGFGGETFNDVAFRSNGELYGYSGFGGRGRSDTNWFYSQIDTGDASINQLAAGANLQTFHEQNPEAGVQVLEQRTDTGLTVQAITIRERRGVEQGFFVGERPPIIGPTYVDNVLFSFAPNTGNAGSGTNGLVLGFAGAGTQGRDLGQIDTTPDGTAGSQLGITGVLEVGQSGFPEQQLFDGDVFTIQSNDGTETTTFEFDFDGTILLSGGLVNDGDTISVGTNTFEFDTGSRLRVQDVNSITGLDIGQRLVITDSQDESITFEAVRQGDDPIQEDAIPLIVRFQDNAPRSRDAIASELARLAGLNLPESSPIASGADVIFSPGTTFVASDVGFAPIGDVGVNPGNIAIPLDASSSGTEILAAFEQALADNSITSTVTDRSISIPGASSIEISSNAFVGGGADGVEVGRTAIILELGDDAATVAQKVSEAINALGGSVTANARTRSVQVINGFAANASGNLVLGGRSQGGTVTGIEIVGDNLFAITDQAELYFISSFDIASGFNREIGTYVRTATDLLRTGETFTGLRAGPNSVDGGLYSDVLFGITNRGNVYAFNTLGELVPYFAGGRSMISTGIVNAQGLDFSTLDYNLWHFDGGNGLPGSGGNGLAFNYDGTFQRFYESSPEYPTSSQRVDGQGVQDTFNFPGGAHGQVQSSTFSLEEYSPSDLPTLYFDYYAQHDGGADSLRVYVIMPDGTEHAVALSTLARTAGLLGDEFDDPDLLDPYNDSVDIQKQQLFNDTPTWRQARIPLGDFAGQDDLKLRFEFSTAGSVRTSSAALRTIAAEDLVEGDSITVNREEFTLDFPPMMMVPSGLDIFNLYEADANAKVTITIDDQTFVFNDGTRSIDTSPIDPNDLSLGQNEVSLDINDLLEVGQTLADLTPTDLAALFPTLISTATTFDFLTDLELDISENSIELGTATTVATNSPDLISIRNVGTPGPNTIPVRNSMTATDVAESLQQVLLGFFLGDLAEANYIPTSGSLITLPSFSVDDYGKFQNLDLRYADTVGATSKPQGARNNDFNGAYLSNFIIGLAERGEQISDPRAVLTDGTFYDNPFTTDLRPAFAVPADPVSDLFTGSYQVEIRDGSEYIESATGAQFRSFDSNDRLGDGLTIQARPASQLIDGQMFWISDGRATVEFEFDSDGIVEPGRVAIPFSMEVVDEVTGLLRPQNASEVADSILAAIARQDVQSVIDARAVASTGFPSDPTVAEDIKAIHRFSSSIDLIGNLIIRDEDGSLAEVTRSDQRGDGNRDRESQGVIMVESSRFLFNEEYGIKIVHGGQATVAGNDQPAIVRYPRNLVELNTEQLVPGVVVQSNVIAFNSVGGIDLQGLDTTADETLLDPVGIDRIVNNTIIGGTIAAGLEVPAEAFRGILFSQGGLSFADSVSDYDPDASNQPPDALFQTTNNILGPPELVDRGTEPVDATGTVSLGYGGSITLQFTDNFLTGSGNSAMDLVVFEAGEIESVSVEISRDGIDYFNVGFVGGLTNMIDIDQFGFGTDDRFSFVRLTDLRQGNPNSDSRGADIDAVGAISSVPVDLYTAGGVGINVTGGSSPTLLNNIIANSETGIALNGGNDGFILGGNSYYRNTADNDGNVELGTLAQQLSDTEAIFVDPSDFVFAPASGARIIDSSIDSLPERSSLTTVRNAIGIAPSPVLAPRLDVNGQTRVDDPNVEPPSGLGERIFKDRGAFDRGDLDGPRVTLLSPFAPNIGLDSGRVTVLGSAPLAFEIQLIDGIAPADNVPGTGVNDATVSKNSLILLKDGEALTEGIDYRFAYDPSANIIRLTPIAGVWVEDSTYVIRMVDQSDAIIQATDGSVYPDGGTFTVVDEQGDPTVFEFETGLTLTFAAGLDGSTADGVQFTVYDGTNQREFELDTNESIGGFGTAVTISDDSSITEIAEALAAAINADPALNLNANAFQGRVQILGASSLTSVATLSNLVQIDGEVGTSTGFGFSIPAAGNTDIADVSDGDSIVIRLGAILEKTFELTVDGIVSNDEAIPVFISDVATLDQVADALVRAIGGAGLGLEPTNEGEGRISIGGDANYSLDLTNSTATEIGLPGDQASTPVTIPIDLPALEIVQLLQQAIDGANLAGVNTSLVDTRVFLEGTNGTSGLGVAETIVIADEVGNLLQSNQADGLTELTIFVGSGYDYGDAPAPYNSLMATGGPRHRVDPSLSLGSNVTADSDGVPNSDNDDGISLPAFVQNGFNFNVGIFVNNTDAGQASDNPVFVDAWFDWNRNGVFENDEYYGFGTSFSGNRIPIGASGQSNVTIGVPNDAVAGETYARFRISETDNLGPLGDASIGEVEDYPISIQSNSFQNTTNQFDTNGNGRVTPLDALLVINALVRNGALPINLETDPVTTPPFPDVNGDGSVTLVDAIRVINHLSELYASPEQIEGEQIEGEQVAGQFITAAPGVMASTPTLVGDLLIASNAEGEQTDETSAQTATPVTQPSTEKLSVFDSPESIQLDSIVDQLASDSAIGGNEGSDDENSSLDDFFASL